MGSKFHGNSTTTSRNVIAAYRSGKKAGQRKASEVVISKDLLLIYNTIIIYLSEQGWTDEAIQSLIEGAQRRAFELMIDEGLTYYQIQEKALQMTGLDVNFLENN